MVFLTARPIHRTGAVAAWRVRRPAAIVAMQTPYAHGRDGRHAAQAPVEGAPSTTTDSDLRATDRSADRRKAECRACERGHGGAQGPCSRVEGNSARGRIRPPWQVPV